MRILVTGGCGFIGSHLIEHHLAKSDEVLAIDNVTTGSLTNIVAFKKNPAFQFYQEDILTWSDLGESVAWADRIYHMAAVLGVYRVIAQPIDVLSTNIMGCERLLKVIVKSKAHARVILASSSSVYGNSSKSLLNEQDSLIILPSTHPLSSYAVSKISDEALANAYFQTYQLPVTSIRLFNIIGPRQTGLYGMVVPRFVQQACRNESLTVYGDGTQTRSFCDVRDSIVALDLIAEKNVSIGEPINVGNNVEITINELADLIRQRANSKSKIEYIPYTEAYGIEFTDVKQRNPDLTKLHKLTDFKHQWTLESTIDDLIIGYYQSC